MTLERANFFNLQIEASNLKSTGLFEVRIMPWGKFTANGKDYMVDEESAASLLAEFEKHGVAVPIDVNHETNDESIAGSQKIGAVGWIESLSAVPGKGIYGQVNWTDEGRKRIRSGAFQYLSPAVFARKDDGKVMLLDSAALVTKPAIPNMERLEASGKTTAHDSSEGALIRAEFGLAPDAPTELVLAAMKGRESLELVQMRQRERSRQVDELVEQQIKGGVINPNATTDVAICREIAARDPVRFAQWMSERPVQLPPGRTTPPSQSTMKRVTTVRRAKDEFHSEPGIGRLVNCKSYVNSKLIECGQVELTEDEVREFAVL